MSPGADRRGWLVPLLCWIAVILDGFDLVVLGALIPTMTGGDMPWMTTAEAAFVSTISLIGMTVGALVIGMITDRTGRRGVLIWTVFAFSVFTLLCGFAQSWMDLGFYRFMAGVGLGGCLPTAIAMVTEFSRGRPGGAATRVMTGYHVGAVATALLALALLPSLGWQAMFWIGAAPGFVLALVMWRHMPESPAHLAASGRLDEARAVAAAHGIELSLDTAPKEQGLGTAALVRPPYLRNSLAIWATAFLGLILVYGLNTWLPKLMITAGYELTGGLWLLLLLNAGAVCGLLVSGRIGDAIGLKRACFIWFGASAVLLSLLSIRMGAGILYPVVFVTGCFVFSAQVLVYAYVASSHPAVIRASALGIAAGVGRLGAILGPLAAGLLLTYGLGYPWGFYAFALAALLAALAVVVWRDPQQ